jgi:hypothetical protein
MEKIIVHQEFAGFEDLFNKFGARDDIPDLGGDDRPCIVDELWQAAPVKAAVKAANGTTIIFDVALPPKSDVDDDASSPFYKTPVIVKDDGRMTLKKRLGIVRSEEVKTADGDTWLHGFDINNQLVDARLIKSA